MAESRTFRVDTCSLSVQDRRTAKFLTIQIGRIASVTGFPAWKESGGAGPCYRGNCGSGGLVLEDGKMIHEVISIMAPSNWEGDVIGPPFQAVAQDQLTVMTGKPLAGSRTAADEPQAVVRDAAEPCPDKLPATQSTSTSAPIRYQRSKALRQSRGESRESAATSFSE
jgi:hypothetical protein